MAEGPQLRAELFNHIENEIESLRQMMVVICDFINELEESQISEASIKLFLEDLRKIPNASHDCLATITILREIMRDESMSGSSSSGSSQ